MKEVDRNNKFIYKFMKIARTVADDNRACYSRKIGVVITDEKYHIVGLGYNGPPAGTPHCDDYSYLYNFYWPQLTEDEQKYLKQVEGVYNVHSFAEHYHQCGQCPRRLINAGPGERSTLCSCQHAERNAITNSMSQGVYMFCWCGVPCIDCTGAIINAGIKKVYCLAHTDYHPTSRYLFDQAGVTVTQYLESNFQ